MQSPNRQKMLESVLLGAGSQYPNDSHNNSPRAGLIDLYTLNTYQSEKNIQRKYLRRYL
jgi:hypothetical protein